MKFVNDKMEESGQEKVDGKVLLICMQVCSFLARVCFGPIADIRIVRRNRILLQQVYKFWLIGKDTFQIFKSLFDYKI